jgi:hypothetical protein
MEEVLLIAAVLGLLWYSKRNQAPRGDTCNQGACVQPTTASANPREQPIILDKPVNTTLRDDRPTVIDPNHPSALDYIRQVVQHFHHTTANAHPGIAIGAPAVAAPLPPPTAPAATPAPATGSLTLPPDPK